MNNQQPLVTYVVLSYNHIKYIGCAIDSILQQTYKNIELIVVDDGSTDGSAEFLSEIQKIHRFKLILQKNSGVVAALNSGVAESSGDYVVLHASDDISEKSRTENQVKLFRENANYGFVVGGIRKISENGDILIQWSPGVRKVFGFDDFLKGQAKAIAVACMYRGSLIRRLIPLDTTFPFEDVQLYWKVTEAGYKCLLDESSCVISYRIIPNSLGRANKINLHSEFLRFIEKYNYHPDFRCALVRSKASLFGAIAEVNRIKAVEYYFLNQSELPFSLAFRGWLKVVLPSFLRAKFKKKY